MHRQGINWFEYWYLLCSLYILTHRDQVMQYCDIDMNLGQHLLS